jgi:hypothetical protein
VCGFEFMSGTSERVCMMEKSDGAKECAGAMGREQHAM